MIIPRMTLEELLTGHAVRIGKIFFQPKDVAKIIARHCHALFILTGDENFPYSIRGSCSTLRLGTRHALVCTLHQIRSSAPDEICFVPRSASWKILISGHRNVIVSESDLSRNEEYSDINAIYFNPSNYYIQNLASDFFLINEADIWPNQTLNKFIVFGHPSGLVEYRLTEDDLNTKLAHIHLTNTYCTADYIGTTEAKWCHKLKLHRSDNLKVDGFSGGPVFHIGKDTRGLFVGFAGIIVRGHDSSDIMYFIDASFVRLLIQK